MAVGNANEGNGRTPALGRFHARIRPAVACPHHDGIWVLAVLVGWVSLEGEGEGKGKVACGGRRRE